MKLEVNFLLTLVIGAASGGGFAYLAFKTFVIEKIKGQIEYQYNAKLESVKSSIKYDYDIKFELIKTNINHEYDVKFESARKELERKAMEHQIQYSKLHIDRSEKLREIHKKLIEGEKSLQILTTLFQGPGWVRDEKRERDALDRLEDLSALILSSRIYFSANLCDKLDKVTLDHGKVIQAMSNAKFLADHENRTGRRVEEYDSPLKLWMKQRDYVEREIVTLRNSIEEEFRKILGV